MAHAGPDRDAAACSEVATGLPGPPADLALRALLTPRTGTRPGPGPPTPPGTPPAAALPGPARASAGLWAYAGDACSVFMQAI